MEVSVRLLIALGWMLASILCLFGYGGSRWETESMLLVHKYQNPQVVTLGKSKVTANLVYWVKLQRPDKSFHKESVHVTSYEDMVVGKRYYIRIANDDNQWFGLLAILSTVLSAGFVMWNLFPTMTRDINDLRPKTHNHY